ncbi:MAG: hypothetical protein AABW68_01710 [archaeon]
MSNRRRPNPFASVYPFRGNTPPGVYQTIEIGSGRATRLRRNAERFPKRKYAAIDIGYSFPLENFRNASADLKQKGVDVYSTSMAMALHSIIKSGMKARNIEMEMPLPLSFSDIASHPTPTEHLIRFRRQLRFLLGKVSFLLLPGGKIFIHTESLAFATAVRELARDFGLSVQERNPMPIREAAERSQHTQNYSQKGVPIRRFVLVYHPHRYRLPLRK